MTKTPQEKAAANARAAAAEEAYEAARTAYAENPSKETFKARNDAYSALQNAAANAYLVAHGE